MNQVAADNDILLKGTWYGLLRQFLAAVPATPGQTLILGQARFVVRDAIKRLARRKGIPGASEAQSAFERILPELEVVEPTDAETLLAARLERASQELHLPIDPGESLLCAVALSRNLTGIATGDKRAIRGLEILASTHMELKGLQGKVVCLEQLLVRVLAQHDSSEIRKAICSRADVDSTLAICLCCTNPTPPAPSEWTAGLESYIHDLRTAAPTLLAP